MMHWIALLLLQDEAVLKVYLYDKDRNPLPLHDVDCRVILEVDGLGRRTLETRRVDAGKPKGRKNHGGEFDDRDGYVVELAIDDPLPDDEPHVQARARLWGLACPMRCEFVEKEGKCPKCVMKVGKEPLWFTAVVVFRVGGEPRNVRFRWPPAPENLKEALRILQANVKQLEETDCLKPVKARISALSERLPDLAAKDDRLDVARIASALDELVQSNAEPAAYKDKISALGKFVK